MPEQAAVVMAPEPTRRQHRVQSWFCISAGLFVILLSVVGFGPSVIDQSRRNAPLTPLAAAHAIVAGAWLLLFITQATLVATRRTGVHRRIGVFGAVLAAVLIVVGYRTQIEFARRGYDLSGDLTRAFTPPGSPPPISAELAAGIQLTPLAAGIQLTPLAGFLNFGVLVAAGLWYRHRPPIHKRLMLLALTPLAGEPTIHLVGHLASRLPVLQGVGIFLLPVQVALPFVVAIYDKVSEGRIHPVSLWVPIVLLAWMTVLSFVVFPSDAWKEFAFWLVQ